MPRSFVALVAVTVLSTTACSTSSSGPASAPIGVVGSFYPLAWLAERVGGSTVHVADLTPPGVEAHDTSLSAHQVAEIDDSDLVLILGFIGFQPQVEDAARQASGTVVEVAAGMHLRPSQEAGLSGDPHVWLDAALMRQIADVVTGAVAMADPSHAGDYRARGEEVGKELADLDAAFRSGLERCGFTTFATTHEAFGYLADEYGLVQLGIEGLTPEAEPAAQQIQRVEDAIAGGTAAPAVFYEGTDEGERIGRSVASDVGVEPIPLGTLEFDPAPHDYVSVMRANLASLREGLRCP